MAEWVRESTGRSRPDGRWFESHIGKTFLVGTLAIPFTPLCQCLSDETVNAVGPFYLVSISMPGEVKVPPVHTGICNVTVVDSPPTLNPPEVRLSWHFSAT